MTFPPGVTFNGDGSLAAVLDALRPQTGLPLVIDYAGRMIQPGYHVTEVKAGSFVTLDCGGNPDAWVETILQIEDLPASAETQRHMAVEKFLAIIVEVGERLRLDDAARLTFEVGPPGEPMQVFDVEGLSVSDDAAVLRLCARPAICKPRHRAQVQTATSSCCNPKVCC
jgi:Family of unknown function (DUF6428)